MMYVNFSKMVKLTFSGVMFACMKILVTGATGFLGSRLLESLSGIDTYTHIIASGRTKRDSAVSHSKIHYLLGDLTDMEYVRGIVQGVDCIVHAAALSSPWGTDDAFEKANVISMKNLVSASLEENVKRLVFISTPSLYFKLSDSTNIKESDQLPRPINSYARTKRMAEILLEESGIPYVILRPRALIGRGDTVILPRLIHAHLQGKLAMIGRGENMVDLTPVSNVVDAIVLSLSASGPALNQTYNISNGDPVMLWDKIQMIFERLNLPGLTKKVPLPIAITVARMMEFKAKISSSKKEPTLTVYGVGTLAKTFTLNIDKARDLLGYCPKLSVDDAVDEYIFWQKELKNVN
jgi:nucleoside-diphosphate-sugar epimerase